MTDATKAMRMALEALEAQHNDRTAYGRAKRKANATCAEFKNSPISELIESGYMQSMGKQTQEAIDALRAAMVKPTGYLIRARWSGGVETYLDVKGVTVLGGGKVGIDVDAPTSHPLADDPDAMAVLGCAQPQRATDAALERQTGEPHVDGWPLFSSLPPAAPVAFSAPQRKRLWDNSPEIHKDATSFAAFARIVALVEVAHSIAAAPKGKA